MATAAVANPSSANFIGSSLQAGASSQNPGSYFTSSAGQGTTPAPTTYSVAQHRTSSVIQQGGSTQGGGVYGTLSGGVAPASSSYTISATPGPANTYSTGMMVPSHRPSQTIITSSSGIPNATATFQNTFNSAGSTTYQTTPAPQQTSYTTNNQLPQQSYSMSSYQPQQQYTTQYPGSTTVVRQAGPSTSYSQYGMAIPSSSSQAATTVGATSQEVALQSAIMQGKVYSPPGAIFVPGSAASRAGIQTLYDAHMVPTFEATLTFPSSQQMIIGQQPQQQQYDPTQTTNQVTTHRAADDGYPHKTSKIVFPQKRSACC